MTPDVADDPRRKPILVATLLLVSGLTLLLFLAGALHARPGSEVALFDLEIVRSWIASGHIGDLSTIPAHLAKPGYLLILRVLLPHGGADPHEVRSVLLVNAALVCTGGLLLTFVFWRQGRRARALIVLSLLTLCLPLRDVCDYVVSEPLAIGFSLFAASALVACPRRRPLVAALIGFACAIFWLIRPNGSYLTLLATALLLAADQPPSGRGLATLVLAFGGSLGALVLIARTTNLPLDPSSEGASQTLLFGTAEYHWPPTVGRWEVGASRTETSRLQFQAARRRWREFLEAGGPDRNRWLLWRLSHSIVSCEQFPARWDNATYRAADIVVRRWWWLAAAFAAAAATLCATAGSGPWRYVPAGLLLAAVSQGVAFGAETRLGLPALPFVIVGIVEAFPLARPRPATWASALVVFLTVLLVVRAVPDAAQADYGRALNAGDVLRQRLSPVRDRGQEVTVHLRLLPSSPTAPIGLELRANDDVVFRREPGDRSLYPAYLTFVLRGPLLDQARRAGFDLQARSLGDPTGEGVLTFPVVSPIFAGKCTLNGETKIPSAFGGWTQGTIPLWTHPGVD